MPKNPDPRRARADLAAPANADTRGALDRLRDAIDTTAKESASDAVASAAAAGAVASAANADVDAWAERLSQSGVLRGAPLSPGAMEILAEIIPPASVTTERRASFEEERFARRAAARASQTLDADCPAASPAELFRDLRERAGVTAERAAAIFGVTPIEWVAIEAKQRPWYRLPPDALPAFAEAVREPMERLVQLLTLTARRALYTGIERRAGLALGRFDAKQGMADARRDTLRFAFELVQADNRGAAGFLERARQAAARSSSLSSSSSSSPSLRLPQPLSGDKKDS